MKTIRTNRARAKFLEVLRLTANVTEACRAANVSRGPMYGWRNDDPEFAAEWDDAEQEATDKLEREAWRRAVEGYDEQLSHQGLLTGDVTRRYSDRLLEILLKGHRPEKYAQRSQVELNASQDFAELLLEARNRRNQPAE